MEEDIVREIIKPIRSNKPGSLLSKFFRQILMELGYTPPRFSRKLNDFVARNNARAKYTSYISTVSRSHVLRKLVNDDFTWKVFILGIFQFLNVKKMKLTVVLTHVNGEETQHTITMVNSEAVENNEEPNDRTK